MTLRDIYRGNQRGVLRNVLRTTRDTPVDVPQAEETVTLGDLHIATKDGESMFFHDSLDFSEYAGSAGNTPYKLVFEDSGGKKAEAYGLTAGGGEALGSELIPVLDFTDAGAWDIINGTPTSADTVTHDTDGLYSVMFPDTASPEPGRIYKSANPFTLSGGVCQGLGGNGNNPIYADSTGAVKYATAINATLRFFWSGLTAFGNETFTLASITRKAVTDIPATGLHLVSTKDGATRNMASVETGFNPNTITSVEIWSA